MVPRFVFMPLTIVASEVSVLTSEAQGPLAVVAGEWSLDSIGPLRYVAVKLFE